MADKQSRGVRFGHTGGDNTIKIADNPAVTAMELDDIDVMPPKNVRNIGDISVKVNVDVSEALTGLKAVQREAREATKALRELEEASTNVEIDGKALAKVVSAEIEKTRMFAIRGQGVRCTLSPCEIERVIDKSITDDIRRSYE